MLALLVPGVLMGATATSTPAGTGSMLPSLGAGR